MSTARQRLGKQFSAATDTQVSVEKLLEIVFLFGPCEVVIKKSSVENSQSNSKWAVGLCKEDWEYGVEFSSDLKVSL
jgi:hypothetical protein